MSIRGTTVHRVAGGVIAGLLLLGAAPAMAESPAELISSFRLKNGEVRVVRDATLDRIAMDQARAMAAKDPSYDIGRVGIYGASAGGQSTLNALLFHGDFYKVGVASAGCYDNRMDKISWNEQWLGWPVDASYAAASGVNHAAQLTGKLLMIVGEQDSNVDPASTPPLLKTDSAKGSGLPQVLPPSVDRTRAIRSPASRSVEVL